MTCSRSRTSSTRTFHSALFIFYMDAWSRATVRDVPPTCGMNNQVSAGHHVEL